jgi:hypothetical protein
MAAQAAALPVAYPSIIQLIVTPTGFEGKRVAVFGFLWKSYDETALCVHKEGYSNYLVANCIRLDASKEVRERKSELDLKYAPVEGLFRSGGRGQLLKNACGGISNISSVTLWSC